MSFEFGKSYSTEIPKGKNLPPFDYPIPDERTNQYLLERLFTDSFKNELKKEHSRAELD